MLLSGLTKNRGRIDILENDYKEVYFGEWCSKCKHYKKREDEDPCYDCLDEPVNVHSHKPVYFEEPEKVNK